MRNRGTLRKKTSLKKCTLMMMIRSPEDIALENLAIAISSAHHDDDDEHDHDHDDPAIKFNSPL